MLFWKKRFWFKSLPHVSFWTDEKDIASDLKKKEYNVLDIEVKNNVSHSELKYSDMSDFEYKKIQRVRFWIQGKKRIRFWNWNFTSHQFLNITFFVWSAFETTVSKHISFWTDEKDIASAFEIKQRQRVRFWVKKFTTHHLLNWVYFDKSDFKEACIQKITFCSFSRWKYKFCFFRAFLKRMILIN